MSGLLLAAIALAQKRQRHEGQHQRAGFFGGPGHNRTNAAAGAAAQASDDQENIRIFACGFERGKLFLGNRATAFGIASVYAVGILRGRRDTYHRKAIALGLSMAAILAPLQVAAGDLLGRTVANHQPATLAAIEGVTRTERGAGLNVGGFPLPGHNGDILNVKVPHLLSLLAFDSPNAPMRGLDTFPKADRTPLAPYVRLAFIGMVGIGTGLVALSLWYWLRRRRGTNGPEDRLTLMAIVAAGPAAFLANELGWLVSELGRQPWIVYGVFRTSSGITTSPGLGATFTAFTLLYVGLTALTIWTVRRIAARPVEGLSTGALGATA